VGSVTMVHTLSVRRTRKATLMPVTLSFACTRCNERRREEGAERPACDMTRRRCSRGWR
jgi:hypothetical protein